MADGSIVLEAEIDQKKIAADLARLKKRITDLQTKQAVTLQLRGDAAAKLDDISVKLDTAKAKLAEMEAAGMQGTAEFERQKVAVGAMQSEFDALEGKVRRYDHALANSSEEIQRAQTELSKLPPVMERSATMIDRLKAAAENASQGFKKIGDRISGLVSRVFVFTLITSALRTLRSFVGSALKSNTEFQASLARLKGALLTAFAPIWQVIVPWIITFINLLTRAITIINNIVSSLFGIGDTAKENAKALAGQAEAIGGVGGAAEKASKQLANFDEINQLSSTDTGGADTGGAGGAGGGAGAPEIDFGGLDDATKQLDRILGYVTAIALGLAAWKIARNFGADLQSAAGIGLAVAGTFEFILSLIDAWNNGVDWGNLTGMIIGAAAAVTGLYLAFSPLAAGIGAIVAGIAMLVVGIREFITTGELTNQTCVLIAAGITAIGVGISLLTGSWIPVVIAAAIAAVGLIIKNWDSIKAFFSNLWENIKTIFSNAWSAIKRFASEAWDKTKAIWSAVAKWFSDAVITPLKNFFAPIADYIGSIFSAAWNIVKAVWILVATWFNTYVVQPTIDFFSPILERVGSFFAQLWDGIKTSWGKAAAWFRDYVTEPISTAFSTLKETVAGFFDNLWTGIKNGVKIAVNSMISGIETFINWVIDGINFFTSKLNILSKAASAITGTKTKSILQINHIALPRLAEGAVIPPNRQFMAVLGDQKSGTNIETPLSTMVQAFKQALAESGGGSRTVILEVDKRQFGKVTFDAYNMESGRVGVRLGET